MSREDCAVPGALANSATPTPATAATYRTDLHPLLIRHSLVSTIAINLGYSAIDNTIDRRPVAAHAPRAVLIFRISQHTAEAST
jgi:hypothetical protein